MAATLIAAGQRMTDRRAVRQLDSIASDRLRRIATLGNLIFVFALIQFVWLVWYFYTGYGGPQELVARVMSIALILQILFMYQQDYLYKWLPPRANDAIVALYIGICVYAFISFPARVRGDRDLAAGLLHDAGFHRRPAGVPAGDGAVAARASGPVLDQSRSGLLHALGLSQPDRLLLASRHDVLPRRHVEHGRAFDRHLRHLWPACAHADRGVPAAGRGRARLWRAERDDQRDAAARRPLAADGAADGRARLARRSAWSAAAARPMRRWSAASRFR